MQGSLLRQGDKEKGRRRQGKRSPCHPLSLSPPHLCTPAPRHPCTEGTPAPLHILLIHQAFATEQEAGGTRHFELARHLVQHGHHVTIIASPVSYLTGQVVPGARGRWVIRESLFVRPGDPEALAEAVLTYYRDPDLRRRHGQNARSYVAAHFDRRQQALKLEMALQRVFRKKREKNRGIGLAVKAVLGRSQGNGSAEG